MKDTYTNGELKTEHGNTEFYSTGVVLKTAFEAGQYMTFTINKAQTGDYIAIYRNHQGGDPETAEPLFDSATIKSIANIQLIERTSQVLFIQCVDYRDVDRTQEVTKDAIFSLQFPNDFSVIDPNTVYVGGKGSEINLLVTGGTANDDDSLFLIKNVDAAGNPVEVLNRDVLKVGTLIRATPSTIF